MVRSYFPGMKLVAAREFIQRLSTLKDVSGFLCNQNSCRSFKQVGQYLSKLGFMREIQIVLMNYFRQNSGANL